MTTEAVQRLECGAELVFKTHGCVQGRYRCEMTKGHHGPHVNGSIAWIGAVKQSRRAGW